MFKMFLRTRANNKVLEHIEAHMLRHYCMESNTIKIDPTTKSVGKAILNN